MTVKDNAAIEVYNLTDHMVVYKIDEDHIRREFSPGETKKIMAKELRKLYYTPGGDILLQDFVSVKNPELASEFGVGSDIIEYKWTVEDIDKALLADPIEVLLDALDFAPEGIKEAIVDRAVALKINNMDKRQAILDKTGQDITHKIQFKEAVEPKQQKEDLVKKRRVDHVVTPEKTGRRVVKDPAVVE